MIAIESGVLVTVAVALLTSGLSIAATWYFARRRFDIPSQRSGVRESSLRSAHRTILLMVFAMCATSIAIVLITAAFNAFAIDQVR